MKSKNRIENISTLVLAGVCAALIIRLLVRVNGVGATASPTAMAQPLQRASQREGLVVTRLRQLPKPEIPVLNVDLYQQLQDQSLPAPGRDPFAFAPTPQQVQAASRAVNAGSNASATPPAPPPPPFTVVGYSQAADGQLEAYLSGDQQVWAVHEGDQFDKTYSIVKITPAMIEIRDESLDRVSQLPIPQ